MRDLLGEGVLDGCIPSFPKFLHVTDPFRELFDTIFHNVIT